MGKTAVSRILWRMSTVHGLYKLSRPMSTLSGALMVVLGGYVAKTGAWSDIMLAAVATLLISAAANAWNDYLDIEIDKVNQPQRPLPAGLISPNQARWFSFTLSILALGIVLFINPLAFAIAFVSVALLYVYSLWLKSTVLVGNITVATISALSPVFGGVAAGRVGPSLWIAATIWVAILGREILKTLADYEGDLLNQCHTIATAWGRRPARILFYIVLGLTLVVMLAPYTTRLYRPIYAYIIALGVFPIIVYVFIRVSQERSGQQLERLSQLMKYDFFVYFVAVLFGAAG